MLVGLQALLAKDYREAAYLESYGSMVASQLARLGQDAMLREDAIALNVLAEQVAAEPAVLQVEIFSMDGATLASYSGSDDGDLDYSREFTRPIQLAEATAGFVKVVVANDALRNTDGRHQLEHQMRSGVAFALAASALGLMIFWLTRARTKPVPGAQLANEASAANERNEPLETNFYTVLAYLFNGNEMPASRRDALMAALIANTNAVAELYQGSVRQLSPTAVTVLFDQVDTTERSYQVACAALVLARLGNKPGGARYRYSLQQQQLPSGSDSLLDPATNELRDDALLHAALAEDNAVVLSAEFARQLPRPERLEITSEHSPALAALHTNNTRDYFLLTGAKPATETMLTKQIEALQAPL